MRADQARAQALQRLKLAKIHTGPHLLERSPRSVAVQFDSPWAPVNDLAERLGPLPTPLLRFLADAPRGHIILSGALSGYQVGAEEFRGRTLQAVAHISVVDLVQSPLSALQMLGHLLDHLLGCQGSSEGVRLSQGRGVNAAWTAVGERIPELFELGYGIDEIARADAQRYFARSVAWYLHDRRQLNVADPLIEKLLRRSLFDERFCVRSLPAHPPSPR